MVINSEIKTEKNQIHLSKILFVGFGPFSLFFFLDTS